MHREGSPHQGLDHQDSGPFLTATRLMGNIMETGNVGKSVVSVAGVERGYNGSPTLSAEISHGVESLRFAYDRADFFPAVLLIAQQTLSSCTGTLRDSPVGHCDNKQ